MANRNWRSGGNYQSFNQLLNPMPYYPPMNYSNDRKNYGGRVGYREENYKRERKDFQSGRRDRISPNRRRSPYQRSHDSHGDFRRDSKKSHGRYEVKAPRLTFDIKELSTSSLKLRYPKMYIPSDFFHTHLRWQEVFPLYRTMKLGNHSEFQILHKDVELDDHQEEVVLEPSDVNYTHSAKVMLMTMPNLADLYKVTCNLSGNNSAAKPLNKNIQFLVGGKGKNEPLAIGGPWSPSLDGLNPDEDPNVLVNTAIRTCKALTGIDLSKCKKWYKFLEIHYYRPSDRQGVLQTGDGDKDETIVISNNETEARVEKVVIFIPDIWSCMPNESEWNDIKAKFEKKLSSLISVDTPEDTNEEVPETKPTEESKAVEEEKTVEEEEDEGNQDLFQLKVVELKAELSSRGLDTKGVKSQLIKRLQEALDKEKGKTVVEESGEVENKKLEADEEKDEEKEKVVTEIPVITIEGKKHEESKELSEKERKRLEKIYKLNDKLSILVQPNKSAKGGKFECNLMTLENLLEYRLDDQKEHIFEVSLFAEQMNEMLQRDGAFYIFKSLSELPELSNENLEPSLKKQKLDNDKIVRKSKMIADMHLLFSFCVFDFDNCGYLRDHDLEDIIHSIGLNFSRSQVRKLISKIPNKRGNLQYRDITDKEVVEGSEEDIAVLKDRKCAIDKLVELSKGNKAFFEESDVQEMIARNGGNLDLLDKLCSAEHKKVEYESQLIFIKDELTKIKSIQNEAGEVETNLKENIRKVQEKLETEKESHSRLSEITRDYHSILKSASDNMFASIKTITDQFEKERLLLEEAKAKEEAEKKMEVEETEAKEPEAVVEDKKWQVVDQV